MEAQPAATAQVVSPWAAQAVQGGAAEERRFDMVPQPIMTPKMLRPGCVHGHCEIAAIRRCACINSMTCFCFSVACLAVAFTCCTEI